MGEEDGVDGIKDRKGGEGSKKIYMDRQRRSKAGACLLWAIH